MFSPEAMRLLMEMEAPQDQKVALLKALERDWQAFSPPVRVGVNEETERRRNLSTYAERKRAKDRERQRRIREEARQSRDVAGGSRDIDGDSTATPATIAKDCAISGESPPSRTYAQVVTPSLPSLRSEELKPPEKTTSSTPKGAETGRGTRIAENWWPVDDYDPSAFGLSREQHDAELAKFLDYWRSVPGAKGRKTDWPATWRNWMRRASENQPRKAHERPDHDPKFAARQANYARALAGADSAAGRTWKP